MLTDAACAEPAQEVQPAKRSKRAAKREREQAEEATHAAELARLAGDAPRDAAYYEREVQLCSDAQEAEQLVQLAVSHINVSSRSPMLQSWLA